MKKLKKKFRRLPVVSHGAEILVQGYLMRRNILAYKAPQGNEGYDLICIHPSPRKTKKPLRIQVKSRYQTDCNLSFPVKEKSLGAFDYLIVAFLNIGNYYHKYKKGVPSDMGKKEPEFYTLPMKFIRKHLNKSSTWEKVSLKKLIDNGRLEKYKGDMGFELIAKDLDVEYPPRTALK